MKKEIRAVWKYTLDDRPEQLVAMPRYAEVIHVAEQYNRICLWAIVDPASADMLERKFFIRATGEVFDEAHEGVYHGTVHVLGGRLVWHVFEELPE